jgi:hypothetical protein
VITNITTTLPIHLTKQNKPHIFSNTNSILNTPLRPIPKPFCFLDTNSDPTNTLPNPYLTSTPIKTIPKSKRSRRLNKFKSANPSKNMQHRIYNQIKHKKKLIDNSIVVNLSSTKLTLSQNYILNKGLNFCINETNKSKISKYIKNEISQFIRRIQINYLFRDVDKKRREPFTGNKQWKPPASKQNQAIATLEDILNEEFSHVIKHNKNRNNISRNDRRALQSLRNNKNIIIKKADKGGCIVILDTVNYINKIDAMLSDETTYSEITHIDLNQKKSEVDRIINNLFNDNFISKRQKNFLTTFSPKIPIFYGLPKIHKNDTPLRPIVSQIDSPSYKINKFLDYILTTAEKEIPYLLQDTTKFLQYINELDKFTQLKPILFTIDVTSLYTVLPHEMCIEYVTEMYTETMHNWDKYTPDIKPISVDYLLSILRVILNQGFFQFDDKIYCQNYGITMGAPSSVKIANITLYKHLDKIQNKFSGIKPQHCYRLIDDIFGLWLDTKESLLAWFEHLNNSHNTIKFTIEYSFKEIPFLDTLVYIENDTVKTRLYKKPIDKKQYLHYNSEHPYYTKNAIPYAQALRYRRIISEDTILNKELTQLANTFIDRGYPPNKVQQQINKVYLLNRSELIQYKEKNKTDINFTPIILTFANIFSSTGKYNIYDIITNVWNEFIEMVPTLGNIKPPKIIFKKCTSIANFVESSEFPPKWWHVQNGPINNTHHHPTHELRHDFINTTTTNTFYRCKPCEKNKCQTCKIITDNTSFISTTYNKTFNIKTDCNCSTKDFIYLITCKLCKIQYVGESGQNLRDRMNNHKSTIRTNKKTAIAIHFNSPNHSIDQLSVTPIEVLTNNSIFHRRTREYYWQLRLGTIFPKGLNNYPVDTE